MPEVSSMSVPISLFIADAEDLPVITDPPSMASVATLNTLVAPPPVRGRPNAST